jgi:hypothetical protein
MSSNKEKSDVEKFEEEFLDHTLDLHVSGSPPPVPKDLEDETKMDHGFVESFYDGVCKFYSLLKTNDSFYKAYKEGKLTEHPEFDQLIGSVDQYGFKIKLMEIERFNHFLEFNQEAFDAHKLGQFNDYLERNPHKADELYDTIFPDHKATEIEIRKNKDLIRENKNLRRSDRIFKGLTALLLGSIAIYNFTNQPTYDVSELKNVPETTVKEVYQEKTIEEVVKKEVKIFNSQDEFIKYVQDNLFVTNDKVIYENVNNYQELAKKILIDTGAKVNPENVQEAEKYLENILPKLNFNNPIYLEK